MVRDRNKLTAFDASEGALYVLFAAVLILLLFSPAFLAIDNKDTKCTKKEKFISFVRLIHGAMNNYGT